MSELFERTLLAGWGDMDFNAHMRNTAYLDKASDVRMMFLAENGLPMKSMAALRVGPIASKDDVEYFREVRVLEPIRVTYGLAGAAEDGSRMKLRNEFYRPDGQLAARVTSYVGWLDLAARKLVAPADTLLRAMLRLPRTDDFEVLPSSLRGARATVEPR
jgi:acyl-CoA thioester hydrolase